MKSFCQSSVILHVLITVEWPLCPYLSPWSLLSLSCWWWGNNRMTWWAPDGQPKSIHHRFVPTFFNADNKIMTFWLPSWAITHDNLLEKYALIPLWSITVVYLLFPNNSADPDSFLLCKTPLASPFKRQALKQAIWRIIFYMN